MEERHGSNLVAEPCCGAKRADSGPRKMEMGYSTLDKRYAFFKNYKMPLAVLYPASKSIALVNSDMRRMERTT